MRIPKALMLCLTIAPVLAGCARDPLVNGPFLIGAERPVIRDGVCGPIGEIRSQDAHGYFKPCDNIKTYAHKRIIDPDNERPGEPEQRELKAASRRQATGSAWDSSR